MLRIPAEENKENIVRVRGCGCNTNALRVIASCRCTSKSRSRSSNEEYLHGDNRVTLETANRRRKSTAEATTYDTYVQKPGSRKPSEVFSYSHIVRQEIRDILEGNQLKPRKTDLNKCSITINQVKPAILINSHFTLDVYKDKSTVCKQQVSQFQRLTAEQKQIRRHSGSSIEGDNLNEKFIHKENIVPNQVPNYDERKQRNIEYYKRTAYVKSEVEPKSAEYPLRRQVTSLESTRAYNQIPVETKTYRDNQKSATCSPILPNCYTRKNTIITKNPDRLRDPKITKRTFKNFRRSSEAYTGDIFNQEYLHDIFEDIKRQEREITLKENFLGLYNPSSECRAAVLNWILREQARLDFSESEYYLAVHILDHVLACTPVPTNMYQLVMISTLWIAMKFMGSNNFKAPTLVRLCENAYASQQLLRMEQKILKIMNFKIYSADPSDCVNYYLKIFNIQDNNLAKLSAYYILDCFSLTPDFSSTRISILAAACVRYILTKYHESEQEIYYIFKKILSPEELRKVKFTEALIYLQLKNMGDKNYGFKAPYFKYGKKKGATEMGHIVNITFE